jgi:hypothetical protein
MTVEFLKPWHLENDDKAPPNVGRTHQHGKRVVIYGAGITGLTAAHELIERGFEVTIVEPDEDPRHPGTCAIGGMARSQWGRVSEIVDPHAQHKPPTGKGRRHGTPMTEVAKPVVLNDHLAEGRQSSPWPELAFPRGIHSWEHADGPTAEAERRNGKPTSKLPPDDKLPPEQLRRLLGELGEAAARAVSLAEERLADTLQVRSITAARKKSMKAEHKALESRRQQIAEDDGAFERALSGSIVGALLEWLFDYCADNRSELHQGAHATRRAIDRPRIFVDGIVATDEVDRGFRPGQFPGLAIRRANHIVQLFEAALGFQSGSEGRLSFETSFESSGQPGQPWRGKLVFTPEGATNGQIVATVESRGWGPIHALDPMRTPDEQRYATISIGPDLLPGEHGYRFFPSFYRHLFDTMRRTPLFSSRPALNLSLEERRDAISGRLVHPTVSPGFEPTGQTAFDQLESVTLHAFALNDGRDPIEMPRVKSASLKRAMELLDASQRTFGASQRDILLVQLKSLQFMATGPKRRQHELENISWHDYVLEEAESADGEERALPNGRPAHQGDAYSQALKRTMSAWPQALIGLRAKEIDARTFGAISTQMVLDQVRPGDYRDGSLNGPTTEAWLDHWRWYLEREGVHFVKGELLGLVVQTPQHRDDVANLLDTADPDQPPLSADLCDRGILKLIPDVMKRSAWQRRWAEVAEAPLTSNAERKDAQGKPMKLGQVPSGADGQFHLAAVSTSGPDALLITQRPDAAEVIVDVTDTPAEAHDRDKRDKTKTTREPLTPPLRIAGAEALTAKRGASWVFTDDGTAVFCGLAGAFNIVMQDVTVEGPPGATVVVGVMRKDHATGMTSTLASKEFKLTRGKAQVAASAARNLLRQHDELWLYVRTTKPGRYRFKPVEGYVIRTPVSDLPRATTGRHGEKIAAAPSRKSWEQLTRRRADVQYVALSSAYDYVVLALPVAEAHRIATDLKDQVAAHEGGPLGNSYVNSHLNQVRLLLGGDRFDATLLSGPTLPKPLTHYAGLQFYLPEDFTFLRGHTYFPNSEWALSSVSQMQFRENRLDPTLSYRGVISVVQGEWAGSALDPELKNMAAWDRSPSQLAEETWRQIRAGYRLSDAPDPPNWFHLDDYLVPLTPARLFGGGLSRSDTTQALQDRRDALEALRRAIGRDSTRPFPQAAALDDALARIDASIKRRGNKLDGALRQWWNRAHLGYYNRSPYLMTEAGNYQNFAEQPGRYQIHFGRVAMAGTYCQTHTRLVCMETANESARHAVNAILRHYKEFSDDDPLGNECKVWPVDERELDDFFLLKKLDDELFDRGLPHVFDILKLRGPIDAMPADGGSGDGRHPTSLLEAMGQVLSSQYELGYAALDAVTRLLR